MEEKKWKFGSLLTKKGAEGLLIGKWKEPKFGRIIEFEKANIENNYISGYYYFPKQKRNKFLGSYRVEFFPYEEKFNGMNVIVEISPEKKKVLFTNSYSSRWFIQATVKNNVFQDKFKCVSVVIKFDLHDKILGKHYVKGNTSNGDIKTYETIYYKEEEEIKEK